MVHLLLRRRAPVESGADGAGRKDGEIAFRARDAALQPSSPQPYYRRVKFSCDRCGQKYFSVDEPVPGQRYSVPCVVCGGALLLKGGDFPALPTVAVDPEPAFGQGSIPDATAEEPLGLALAPAARPEPRVVPQRPLPRRARRTRVAPVGRSAARATGIVLATAAAGILVFVGVQRLLSAPGQPRTDSGAGGDPPVAPAPVGDVDSPTFVPPHAASSPPSPAASSAPSSPAQKPPPPSPGPGAPRARVGPGKPMPAAAAGAGRPAAPASSPPPQTASSTRPTLERVTTAIAAKRPELDACFRESQKVEPELRIGRGPFHLRLTVNPDGIVTETEIDDPVVQNAVLGACVRAVVRGLVFPMFKGEPVQMRVPLAPGGE